MDPKKITELARLFRCNGDKILNSESTLTLSGSILLGLNDAFTLITDNVDCGTRTTFEVLKPNNSISPVFHDLQLIHDFLQKTTLLCIIQYQNDDVFNSNIDISKFRTLKRLEVQRINIKQIVGIQPLRAQIEQLVCVKCLKDVDDIIIGCGGDNTQGFMWNRLQSADFSYNSLQKLDSALEFAQYLQHLNLRHNKLNSVEAIKWLPLLKTLDLSYNRLQVIPQFHIDACKRLQTLNLSNNEIEELTACILRMESLIDLNLSDNCLLNHALLAPLTLLNNLKSLNLYGNPLHYHPKHRLATAQFLNTFTKNFKFLLDFEPLTKAEKAVIGTQQIRHIGTLQHLRGSSSSISTLLVTPSTQTPASSVGSLRSFRFKETNSTDAEKLTSEVSIVKKRKKRVRTVEIEDENAIKETNDSMTTSTNTLESHLETKKELQLLRERYGADWLHNATSRDRSENLKEEVSLASNEFLNNSIDDWSNTAKNVETIDDEQKKMTSTPLPTISVTNNTIDDEKLSVNVADKTLYMSFNQSNQSKIDADTSVYKSIENTTNNSENVKIDEKVEIESDDEPEYLKNVYSTISEGESEASEVEDDEETYNVCSAQSNEAILSLSSNFLREKDTITKRTKTKWSLRILESCDRIKSNMLRINFDTIRRDKKERIYTVENDLCQQLENKLRDILSKRDLSEMNQMIYRCLKCALQFSRENQQHNQEIHCPDCSSTFVAQVHDIPQSNKKSSKPLIVPYNDDKLSPASVVEESPVNTTLPTNRNSMNNSSDNSIGPTRLIANNTHPSRNLMQVYKSSAGSLNDSSSCSKISKSQSSFDSNQSVVGSSTAERDQELKSNIESDVDIISNPSQSSIEVLDSINFSSRKSSEDHRLIQIPNLETIPDHNVPNNLHLNEFISHEREASVNNYGGPKAKSNEKIHFNLTESSSSGSVTDSVCTAYEQQQQQNQQQQQQQSESNHDNLDIPKNHLTEERNKGSKKDDTSISSKFGALFESTNVLMSSSKKSPKSEIQKSGIDNGQATTPIKSLDICTPYKFNYMDFNDIDHRIKLYFYQEKFEQNDEHFKWMVRGQIFNENTQTLFNGIIALSTCKCFIMEAYADEQNDVSKWLRQVTSVSVDRLEYVKLLPWKMGLSLKLRDWGGILLLLQDILRTDSLLLHFSNNALPPQCELNYQIDEIITKRLSIAVNNDKLKMCSLLNGCEIIFENAKRNFNLCALLVTDNKIYLTSSNKLNWLSVQQPLDDDIEICMTQFMTYLIEVERPDDNVAIINFLDDTQNKSEYWHCIFETKENADSSLNAIGQSWEQLFGVSLFNS